MTISIFELFSIGIGPSSSHTVGPMRAAQVFAKQLVHLPIARVLIEVFGSLALTGEGHGTDKAIINGLEGQLPDTCIPENLDQRLQQIKLQKILLLNGKQAITFNFTNDFIFDKKNLLPRYSNGMRFSAFDHQQQLCQQAIFYSVGGGFIISDHEPEIKNKIAIPYPFKSAAQLLALCRQQQCTIAQLMWQNEKTWYDDATIDQKLMTIYETMQASIVKGCQTEGLLPGFLKVRRRASALYKKMLTFEQVPLLPNRDVMQWLNIYAMAVNEENAAGGRVVTAPTNGAAGVIPAVLNYYRNFLATDSVSTDALKNFLLTAGAIAILYKKGASISGAEVGCQGEVGVASSMAAGALTSVLGGSLGQIEKAAEIAMEHHLGMTCDPVGGLVQIPCIERNGKGAVKAVNAARLALMEDEEMHHVSLDKVIQTMLQTGKDMQYIYKETSLGGLAAALAKVEVNVPEC